MDLYRFFALLLIPPGLFLALIGPSIPAGQGLVPIGPPSPSHVTGLAAGADDTLLAATQAGEVWRYDQEQWTKELDLAGKVITAMAGEPPQAPIGTGSGLWWPDQVTPPGDPSILDVLEVDDGMVVTTGQGVWILADGRWQHRMPELNSYRVAEQHRRGNRYLHVGTIGDGVYSIPTAERLEPWRPNNRELPEGIKVLSLAVTKGGLLLAGTDRGLYWQVGPGHPWKELSGGVGRRRAVALHLTAAEQDELQRLWVGTDDGLMKVDLTETPGALIIPEPARLIIAAPGEPSLEAPVSAIVAIDERLIASAGTVYELESSRATAWYLASPLGVALIIIGGWLGLKPRPPRIIRRKE